MFDADSTIGTENLLQSHTGVIRAFPAVPQSFSGGFENFGAQGAFIVASERSQDGVTFIRVESLAGNGCVVANPWPDREVSVVEEQSGQGIAATVDQRTIRFETEAGSVYRLEAN